MQNNNKKREKVQSQTTYRCRTIDRMSIARLTNPDRVIAEI